MCLNKVYASSYYDKNEDCTVSIGYKALDNVLNNRGEWSDKKLYKFNEWIEAKKDWSGCLLDNSAEIASENNIYIPGFHIFTDLESAIGYDISLPKSCVVKVLAHDILAVGTNYTHTNNNKYIDMPCIVSRWMKIIEVVKKGR